MVVLLQAVVAVTHVFVGMVLVQEEEKELEFVLYKYKQVVVDINEH